MPGIAELQKIVDDAEARVSARQDDLAQSAAALAVIVGPLAASHRLAILAQEYYDLQMIKAGN